MAADWSEYVEKLHREATRLGLPDYLVTDLVHFVLAGQPQGSFGEALVSNNLIEAFKRADQRNTAVMKNWAAWIYQHWPAEAWGSAEKYRSWRDRGGLKGISEEVAS